jgi:hypothetical protein
MGKRGGDGRWPWGSYRPRSPHLEGAAEERLGENGKNFGRHKAGL